MNNLYVVVTHTNSDHKIVGLYRSAASAANALREVENDMKNADLWHGISHAGKWVENLQICQDVRTFKFIYDNPEDEFTEDDFRAYISLYPIED